MSILVGGNFASGAAVPGFTVQSSSSSMGSRIRLAKMDDGTIGLASTLHHKDYADTGQLRSELSANSALATWGKVFRAGWIVRLPPGWVNHGSEEGQVLLQMHEVNAAAVSRRPAFAGELRDGVLSVILAHDDAPDGDILTTVHMVPGRDYSIWAEVRWADGTNEPTANGYLNLYVDGALVAQRTGRNHWATVDPNPPYLKCGVYVPDGASPWWAGKSRTVWHRGAVMADGGESFEALQSLMKTATVSAAPQVLL